VYEHTTGVARLTEHRRCSQVQQQGADVLETAMMLTYMVSMQQVYFSYLFNPFRKKDYMIPI
jgi:hypothetical protein